MSKFIEQVQANMIQPSTYRAVVEPFSALTISQDYSQINAPNREVAYEFGVHWIVAGYVQEPAVGEQLVQMKKSCIEMLRDDMYGEYIHDLLELRWKLKSREYQVAEIMVEKLLTEVTGRR